MQEAMQPDFQALTHDKIDLAVSLCDACVGENLYTKEILEAALEQKDHFFYFILGKAGEVLGYIYFCIRDREEFLSYARADRSLFDRAIPAGAVLAELRSIAVCKEYRHLGLSERMLEFYLEFLKENTRADVACGVFWSVHGEVPMQKSLEAFSFDYLQTTHKVWYDFKNLKCPFCDGKCLCDAAVYYKILEARNET